MAQDRYKYFRIEAREILDQLGRGALALEAGPAPDAVAALLRHAHTLKGAARVVRQREIADAAHALEDVLAPFRDGEAAVPREAVDRVLALADEIGRHVARLGTAAPADAEGAAAAPAPSATAPAAADPVEPELA